MPHPSLNTVALIQDYLIQPVSQPYVHPPRGHVTLGMFLLQAFGFRWKSHPQGCWLLTCLSNAFSTNMNIEVRQTNDSL